MYIYKTIHAYKYYIMASTITVKIKLDPFYQEFLRKHFKKQTTNYFMFDKSSDLSIAFQALLIKPPSDYEPFDYGEESFEIEIPYNEHKDPYSYNYISKKANTILNSKIEAYFNSIFHEEVNKLRKPPYDFTIQNAIYVFMTNYDLSPKYFDRLEKNHKRYRSAISSIKCRRKKEKKNSKFLLS